MKSNSTRRHILLLVIAMGLSLSFSLAVGPSCAGSADDWQMFRHDLVHSGYSTSPAPAINQTSWIRATPDALRASPAIVDGVVYEGTFGGDIFAVNAKTGALIWNITVGDAIWSSPAVADGVVYVGSNDFYLYALKADTGAKLWQFNTGGGVFSAPSVHGGRVFIGSTDNRVYALDAGTGAQLWSYETGGQVRSSPAIAEGALFIYSQDGYVYALNATSGALLWKTMTAPGDSYTTSSPAVSGGIVYVGSWDNRIRALNATTGTQLWYHTTGGITECSPAVAYGMVFVGSDGGGLGAFNASTGEMIWGFPTDSQVYSSPAVADGMVFFGTWYGDIYALDAYTGALKWNYRAGGGIFSSPAIADGLMCIGSYDGKLYAFGSYSGGYVPPEEFDQSGWSPEPANAAGAAAAAVLATGAASMVSVSIAGPIGGIGEAISEKLKDLLPGNLKKWLEYFIASKRKLKVEGKSGSPFVPMPGEWVAYAVSVALLAVSFAYVKAGSLSELASLLPVYFATSIVVGLVKRYFTIAFLRSRGVWSEHKVWIFGLALFAFTTLVFRVPFSTPTRNVSHSANYTGYIKARVAISWITIGLAFTGLFALLMPLGFVQVGSAGLAMCILGALFDALPIPPLVGKDLFDENKRLWAIFFAATLAIYVAWLLLM